MLMLSVVDSFSAYSNMKGHLPVLAEQTIELLEPQKGGLYIDCTFGGGGHTELLLEAGAGKVIGLDQDPSAVARADALKVKYGERFEFRRMNFRDIDQLEEMEIEGFLFDFGVSSFQLDEIDRGFSFRGDAPLDMRMNPEAGLSAADWLAEATREQLIEAVRNYGEERNWRRIVDTIIEKRGSSAITTTTELADLVLSCTPARIRFASKLHPATKTFQGIRIVVNDEISVIEEALPIAFERLRTGGRLCVISFHSLEDRIAKRLFRHLAGRPEGKKDNRTQDQREVKAELVGRRPTTASDKEIADNPRSRSAKLRALRKVI